MRRPVILGVLAAVIVPLGAALAVLALAADGPKEMAEAPDVLIVQAGGTPFEGVDHITPANVDAVSCPTPVARNCRTVADAVAEALRTRQVRVKVLEAGQFKDRREVAAARMVVLASPAFFGNPSWRMFKFVDEVVWQFFALGGKRLDGKPFAALAIGHSEPGCASAIASMQRMVKSANGTAGPTVFVLAEHSDDEVRKRVARFAEDLVAAMKETR